MVTLVATIYYGEHAFQVWPDLVDPVAVTG